MFALELPARLAPITSINNICIMDVPDAKMTLLQNFVHHRGTIVYFSRVLPATNFLLFGNKWLPT